ncbi:MAG: 30S ribosomal protein S2 [Rickettsiales bacterium]|nr:30S ribosomal protein S2 [Pseudomonadota bacterium]MDA0965956.1 30S ribosomal protein S2 [Pseudomonadota bacterium]MDG4542572.1 30S ribosomal protein S2 [Rickettsiales bacterium]MDG4545076.1 30S ribosomal protein S2 [Rickettsiales bacterium]MDG4547199.1 30S ribosomal protein S2 [Rickettsiales bacterium]
MSALPKFTMRELLEAGVHYGHRTMRWNPKMAPFLYGSRNGTHIIDLQQTAPMLHQALVKVHEVVRKNGRVLFVGTKRQASESIAEEAKRCGQYYVNHRWLGGMLTNWKTVSGSIKTLRDTEAKLEGNLAGLKKKEVLSLQRRAEKIRLSLGGIMDMGGKPDLLFVIDVNKESLALLEAQKLGVPVIAVVDSNASPDGVDYPIPGNDDAIRSIKLYCRLVADSALAGLKESLGSAGVDIGSAADIAAEILPMPKNDNSKRVSAAKDNKKPAAQKASDKKDEKATAAKEEKKPEAKKADAKEEKKPAAKAKKADGKPAEKKTASDK